MHDPRLSEWLELTNRALDAPEAEFPDTLREVYERRAELQSSLEETPLSAPLSPDFGGKLRSAEESLHERSQKFVEGIQTQLGELRQVKAGTKGYRLLRTNLPAFLSRSV